MRALAWDAERAMREPAVLEEVNAALERMMAEDRVQWAVEHLSGDHAVSSSFGAQAAVSLHLVTRVLPTIPVILIDTGYLFPATYRFVDELTLHLGLNLKVYQAQVSPAWLEARHGRLWERGLDGIERYNKLRKTEPMQRSLAELNIKAWYAGLRRDQTTSRRRIRPLEWRDGRWKVHPILDWTDRAVFGYLQRNGLPYHPLWNEGYVSIGDWHTTRSLAEAGDPQATRFFGLKRECGLHGLEG